MSKTVINLRKARKQKQRREREAEAAGNRTKFGQPAVLRKAIRKQDETEQKRHDGHRLEKSDKPD